MVLNLLRVEEVNPEFMMERSFHQFQNYTNLPKLYEKVKALESQIQSFEIDDESEVMSYYRLREQLTNLNNCVTDVQENFIGENLHAVR